MRAEDAGTGRFCRFNDGAACAVRCNALDKTPQLLFVARSGRGVRPFMTDDVLQASSFRVLPGDVQEGSCMIRRKGQESVGKDMS